MQLQNLEQQREKLFIERLTENLQGYFGPFTRFAIKIIKFFNFMRWGFFRGGTAKNWKRILCWFGYHKIEDQFVFNKKEIKAEWNEQKKCCEDCFVVKARCETCGFWIHFKLINCKIGIKGEFGTFPETQKLFDKIKK